MINKMYLIKTQSRCLYNNVETVVLLKRDIWSFSPWSGVQESLLCVLQTAHAESFGTDPRSRQGRSPPPANAPVSENMNLWTVLSETHPRELESNDYLGEKPVS